MPATATVSPLRQRAWVLIVLAAFLFPAMLSTAQIRVQAIHNSPYAEAAVVDVYLAGTKAADDFAFRTASGFIQLPAFIPPGSTLNVDVTDANASDNSAPIFSKQITFPAGSTVIVAAGDPLNRSGNPPFDLYSFGGLEQSETPGNLSALFFHGVPDAPTIDLLDRVTGTRWADDLAYGGFTPAYADLAADAYALGVSPADDADASLLGRFLAFDGGLAGSALIVLASGFIDSEPSIAFIQALADGTVSALPEVIDIGNARTAPDVAANLAIEGVVTRSKGRLTYVQEDSAGIAVFQTSGTIRDAVDAGDIVAGDSVVISGDRSDFSSLQQIAPSNFVVLSRGHALPTPQQVTLAELAVNGENYESEIVRLTDLAIDPAGDIVFSTSKTYGITDPSDVSGAVPLRTPGSGDTDIGGVTIPAIAAFQGVVGQFSSSDSAAGYQLLPINTTDIEVQSGVANEGDLELPNEFALLNAYPNPFNPATTLAYELPEPANVFLEVFDLLGKSVRLLEAGPKPAGRHEVIFDADGLSSGIYLFRLEAGDYVGSKTVVLMR